MILTVSIYIGLLVVAYLVSRIEFENESKGI